MEDLILQPIDQQSMDALSNHHGEDCQEALSMWKEFYKVIGFHPPWIGYLGILGNEAVGTVAFKGPPSDDRVEIAYWTFDPHEGLGIGTAMCRLIVEIAVRENPGLIIAARTLPKRGPSVGILEKNGFVFFGDVVDKEDGNVWEWRYHPGKNESS